MLYCFYGKAFFVAMVRACFKNALCMGWINKPLNMVYGRHLAKIIGIRGEFFVKFVKKQLTYGGGVAV